MEELDNGKEVSVCINEVLKQLDLKTYKYETSLKLDKGVNYMSKIERICIKGQDKDDKNIELNLIVKIAPTHPPVREYMEIENAYKCETFMYKTVFSLFSKMECEANVVDGFSSYPKYFASSAKYLNELVVLEDMKQYKVVDRQSTLDLDHVLLLVKEVGKLHAMSFVLRQRNRSRFYEIAKNIRNETFENSLFSRANIYFVVHWIPRMLATLDAQTDKLAYKKLYNFKESITKCFEKFHSIDSFNEYGVIGHCDYWASNLMFHYHQDRPDKVCIIDWQTARVCSPAVDLSEILFACCDAKTRKEHLDHLIEAYYNSFCLHLQCFGEDANELFPFSILQDHIKEYSGYGLTITLRTVCMLSVLLKSIPDFNESKTLMDFVDVYVSCEVDKNIFNKRIRDIVMDYVNYGYDM